MKQVRLVVTVFFGVAFSLMLSLALVLKASGTTVSSGAGVLIVALMMWAPLQAVFARHTASTEVGSLISRYDIGEARECG